MTKRFEYEQDKFLEYGDFGNKNDEVLVVNHGLMGSAKNQELGDALSNFGIRVITIARCGYGDSSVNKLNSFIDFAKIVEKLMDFLEVKNFNTLGVSAGTPHSYAYGAYMKERVKNIFIFSGLPIIYKENVINAYPDSDSIKAYYHFFKDEDVQSIGKKLLNDFESALPKEFKQSNEYKDSIVNEAQGIGNEAKMQSKPWGFEIEDIEQPVYLQHSTDDNIVPFSAVEAGLKYFKNYNIIRITGADHFDQKAFLDYLEFLVSTIKN